MMYYGCKETLKETPNSKGGLKRLKELVYFIFYFEFEYRTSGSIKGDTNSVQERIKCSYPSTPYIQPAIKCQELLIPILFWRAWVLRAWRRSLRALSVGPAVGVEGEYPLRSSSSFIHSNRLAALPLSSIDAPTTLGVKS